MQGKRHNPYFAGNFFAIQGTKSLFVCSITVTILILLETSLQLIIGFPKISKYIVTILILLETSLQ